MYISEFSIKGYRSLKDIEIRGMLPVCVFHGPNNSGKSNILAAIETIFSRKLRIEETTTTGTTTHTREAGFWQGRISDFRDNFYRNAKTDIAFFVSVTFQDSELRPLLKEVLPKLTKSPQGMDKPEKTDKPKILSLKGQIVYVDDNSADMILQEVTLNRSQILFRYDNKRMELFPSVDDINSDTKLELFETLMNQLTNSFTVITADRYLTSEKLVGSPPNAVISPKTFKDWLFKLSLSRTGHSTFEEIKTMFSTEPFSVGEIGFSQEDEEIEIMVKEKNVRLPIGRLGSGYQQILYIIASLILNKNKMLGIEELEINLSPKMQMLLFEKIKAHVYKSSDLASQVIITSHSDYFEDRMDVRCYGVTHDGDQTVVARWTAADRKKFFHRKRGSNTTIPNFAERYEEPPPPKAS